MPLERLTQKLTSMYSSGKHAYQTYGTEWSFLGEVQARRANVEGQARYSSNIIGIIAGSIIFVTGYGAYIYANWPNTEKVAQSKQEVRFVAELQALLQPTEFQSNRPAYAADKLREAHALIKQRGEKATRYEDLATRIKAAISYAEKMDRGFPTSLRTISEQRLTWQSSVLNEKELGPLFTTLNQEDRYHRFVISQNQLHTKYQDAGGWGFAMLAAGALAWLFFRYATRPFTRRYHIRQKSKPYTPPPIDRKPRRRRFRPHRQNVRFGTRRLRLPWKWF